MSQYKVIEEFELAGATPEDASVKQEVGAVIELTDEQAVELGSKVEAIPATEPGTPGEGAVPPAPETPAAPAVEPGAAAPASEPASPAEIPPAKEGDVPAEAKSETKDWAGNHTV